MKNLAYRCLASGLALLLAVNTPVFGRWAHSHWGSGCWSPAPMAACQPTESYQPCSDPCSSPCGTVVSSCGCSSDEVVMGSAVIETPVGDCGCNGVTTSTVHEGSTVHEAQHAPATQSHSAAPQPTLAEPPLPTEVVEEAPQAAFGDGFRSDTPKDAMAEEAAPSDAWDAGFNSAPAVQQPEVAEPAELQAGADMPLSDEEPAMEEPADDLFGDTPVEEPAEEEMPADDLFGAPADDFAAEEAAADEPAKEDLFGAPADEPVEEEPVDDLFGAPAEEPTEEEMPADDLFGEPADAPADEPAGDLFDEPAEEPAAADDDLFGSEPEAAPAEETPADDLFGAPADEPVEEEPVDDLFGAPAEEPAEEEMPADDLFGEVPVEETPADDLFGEEPAAEAPAAEEPTDSVDDLFGGEEDDAGGLFGDEEDAPAEDDAEDDLFGDFGAILGEPGGVQSGRDRTWIDNTGRHSTVGRLIAIDGGSIRLAKHDGGVATVPLGRLSQSDLEFVSRQAIAMTEAREWAIANGKPADKNAPKQARSDEKLPLRTAQL